MAEVGDKLVNLNGLKAVFDLMDAGFSETLSILQGQLNRALELFQIKLDAPKVNGTIGQVLTLKDDRGNTEWKDMPGNVDVVRQSTHHTDYTRDTLEFVTDSTGKVTNVYFMSKQVN